MRWTCVVGLSLATLSIADAARAEPRAFPPDLERAFSPDDASAQRAAETSPATLPPSHWQPNPTLARVGAALFLGGYAPAAGAALTSTAHLAYVYVRFSFTVGLECYNLTSDGTSGGSRLKSDAPPYCSANFGAAQLWVPVAGPFLFLANHPKDSLFNEHGSALSPAGRAILYASGIAQAAGVTLVLASGLFGGPTTVKSAKPQPQLRFMPMKARHSVGMSVTFDGW